MKISNKTSSFNNNAISSITHQFLRIKSVLQSGSKCVQYVHLHVLGYVMSIF